MLNGLLYLLLLLIELAISFSLAAYSLSMLYSSVKGAPYVPTRQKELAYILHEAKLKKGSLMIEPGSGDGRVLRTAARLYGVRGIGIDVNLLLTLWARFLAYRQKIASVRFITKNIFDSDYRSADTVYLFLMPALLEKLAPILKRQLKADALVISHGFKIGGWDKRLVKQLDHRPFPTYYYRLS